MDDLHDSPVLALEHNVTWAFENATPYAGKRLSEAVATGLINPEIGLNCDNANAIATVPPKGPHLQRLRSAGTPKCTLA